MVFKPAISSLSQIQKHRVLPGFYYIDKNASRFAD